MIEQITPPNSGPPVHRHNREEESFFIVEGSFLFLVGEEKIEARAGRLPLGPAGYPSYVSECRLVAGKSPGDDVTAGDGRLLSEDSRARPCT
jgi:hypothetical protein